MSESDEFLSIDTPENVIFDYEVVGIGTRFIAGLADSLILFVTLLVVNLAAFFLLRTVVDLARGWVSALFVALSFAISWGYYLFFELRWNGQSPGKRWTGVRVIRRDGTPITLSESIIRNLVRVVDFLPVAYGLGIITMFIHPQSCRLGDLAAGTLVVRDQGDLSWSGVPARPMLRAYLSPAVEARIEQWPLERLSDADIQLAQEYMQRRHGLSDHTSLAIAIIRRLLVKMELPDEPIHESDAPFILASIVKARQDV